MTEQEHKNRYLKNQFSGLSDEQLDFLRPQLTVTTFNKKDFYLKRGDVQTGLGFVSEGLVRRYYINEKANEITTGFMKENQYVTDYAAFIQQKPTKYFLQCLEPTVIVSVPYNTIQESYRRFTEFQFYGRMMAEQTLSMYNDRIEDFLFCTAEERYVKFMKEHADLLNRVSLTHLSTFLGIERQSLSRIRSRIASRD